MRQGFTLIEVLIAIAIFVISLTFIFALSSWTNETSGASIHEIMASRYAAELAEQIQRLAPKIKTLKMTTGVDIKGILESLNPYLGPGATGGAGPAQIYLPGSRLAVFVTPLNPNFIRREIRLRKLSAPAVFNTGTFWETGILFSWKHAINSPVVHSASFSMVLYEEN